MPALRRGPSRRELRAAVGHDQRMVPMPVFPGRNRKIAICPKPDNSFLAGAYSAPEGFRESTRVNGLEVDCFGGVRQCAD